MANDTTFSNISSESVKNATGRSWDQWFDMLDEAGAANMKHAEIARWLASNHLENAWWCQGVTVAYEQARGLRKPHQKADGFSVSISKTIAAPVSSIYTMWVDEAARSKWMDLDTAREIKFSTANLNKNLRARWPDDDSLLIVYFYEKDNSRCQVVVQCEQLSAADDVEPRRAFWKNALGRLAAEN